MASTPGKVLVLTLVPETLHWIFYTTSFGHMQCWEDAELCLGTQGTTAQPACADAPPWPPLIHTGGWRSCATVCRGCGLPTGQFLRVLHKWLTQ
jgi:hypothetical protein